MYVTGRRQIGVPIVLHGLGPASESCQSDQTTAKEAAAASSGGAIPCSCRTSQDCFRGLIWHSPVRTVAVVISISKPCYSQRVSSGRLPKGKADEKVKPGGGDKAKALAQHVDPNLRRQVRSTGTDERDGEYHSQGHSLS